MGTCAWNGKKGTGFCSSEVKPCANKSQIGILQYRHIKAFVTSDCPCFSFGLMCFCFFHLMWDLHRDCGMSSSPSSISAAVQLPKNLFFWPPQNTNIHSLQLDVFAKLDTVIRQIFFSLKWNFFIKIDFILLSESNSYLQM